MMLSFLPVQQVKAFTDTSSIVDIKDYSAFPNETQYKITDTTGLSTFSSAVNDGNNFSGTTIYLANNITFNRVTANNFTPIGVYSVSSPQSNRAFSGTFDGNGYIISGVNVSRSTSDDQSLLFNYLNGASLKDVNLSNSTITGRYNIGGIACISIDSSIDNCTVDNTTTVRGVNDVAGVSETANNTGITNCTMNAGIIGQNYLSGISLELSNGASIENCVNNTPLNCSSFAAVQ